MPVYCKLKTEKHGEFFLSCGTPRIAGRSANSNSGLTDDDYSLVIDHGFNLVSNHSSSFEAFKFNFHLTVPAYEPIKASMLNVVNNKDPIEEMTIVVIISHQGKFYVSEKYVATDGKLTFASFKQRSTSDNNTKGEIHLACSFNELNYDNNMTQTCGTITTSLD
jgi:hypothetical protein